MSCSVEQRLNQYREDVGAHAVTFSEIWTLYPSGVPITMQVIFRGFRLADDRMAMLCEALEAETIAPGTLRTAEALQKVRRSVARLTEIMESVLNAARLEEGRVRFAPERCSLLDIIRETCESDAEGYPDHPVRTDIDHLSDPIVTGSEAARPRHRFPAHFRR